MYEKREQKRNLLQYDASGRNDPGIEYVWDANGRPAGRARGRFEFIAGLDLNIQRQGPAPTGMAFPGSEKAVNERLSCHILGGIGGKVVEWTLDIKV